MDGTTELLDSDRRFLVHPLHHPEDHKTPLVVEEGRGSMLRLADGREVIDGLGGLWNVNAGHGRGELADAASGQMRKIAYASAYVGMTNAPAIQLAEKIVGHAYASSSAVYYTTAGAESNESAFKTARYFWKVQDKPNKVKIISRQHGYHGVTMAAMSATGMAVYHKMFGPLMPGFIQVAAPYAYRWQGNEECGLGAAEAVEKAILAEGADTVAAVICEPVMGAGGVILPPDTYFPKLREICDRYEVLLIADEIITGFGRTGRVTAKGSKAPALGLGVKVAREAMARGLLVRARPGSADPAMGDTLCLSPPLSTPADVLDRIPQILRESVIAATK